MNLYLLIITPFIAAGIAQASKSIFNRKNPFKIKELCRFSYSGMPSGHSAFVSSLATIIGIDQGFNSPVFALALAFAVLTINDALRLRQYLGQQGAVLNVLIEDLKDDQFLDEKYPILKERIGHTVYDVSAGILLGISVAYILFSLAK